MQIQSHSIAKGLHQTIRGEQVAIALASETRFNNSEGIVVGHGQTTAASTGRAQQ
jgi:hypothetical protein